MGIASVAVWAKDEVLAVRFGTLWTSGMLSTFEQAKTLRLRALFRD